MLKFVVSKEERPEDGKELFNDLYASANEYKEVVNLIRECIRKAVPDQLIGSGNKQILMEMMGEFVSMKRFENYKM